MRSPGPGGRRTSRGDSAPIGSTNDNLDLRATRSEGRLGAMYTIGNVEGVVVYRHDFDWVAEIHPRQVKPRIG